MIRLHAEKQPVPFRALSLSIASLVVPVAAAFWFPDWTSTDVGMLIWLAALIPAFLLAYYRGSQGVAIALAGGMAVITATQFSVSAFQIAEPNFRLLGAIVVVYLGLAMGIAGLAEVLRRERRAAEEMALIDRLTGLPNRRHADLVLDREFAAAARGHNLVVVLFDLDHFKSVNDKHGHAAGDQVLRAFARVLDTNTRKENISARFGGEEFVTILRDSTLDGALVFAQRVLDQTRALQFSWGRQTVSGGIAAYEDGMGSHEVLLANADRALYQAKDGGRDRLSMAPLTAPPRPGRVPRPQPPRVPTPAPAGPPARIYVVDDDAAVRGVMKRFLVGHGHTVWDTGDPREAIRMFTESAPADRPNLILTDVIMPEMSGMRMIDQITRVQPDVRVIYMSGYVQSAISWPGTPGSVVTFLEKPVDFSKLIAAVEAGDHRG